MAFGLSGAYIYPRLISAVAGKRRADQIIELLITGTTADVVLDVGNLSGTFWTAVGSTAPGQGVLAALTALYPRLSAWGWTQLNSQQLGIRVQVASLTGAGQKLITTDSTTLLPCVSVNAADGLTAWQLQIVAPLNIDDMGMTAIYPPSGT